MEKTTPPELERVLESARSRAERTREWIRAEGTALDSLHDAPQLNGQLEAFAEELARANEELVEKNRQLDEFAYVVSHDLQAPLRTVSSWCDRLERDFGGKLDPRAEEMVGHVAEAAGRMRDLILDLLEYSRAGRGDEALEPLELDELARLVLSDLGAAIAEAGARVELGPLQAVRGDRTGLLQLLQNLIGNALKFRRETDPFVRVWTRACDEGVELCVADNGIGIAPEQRERVFGVFKRLHTREEYPGTGIGLSVCRRIAERHGGRIRIENGPEGGSLFAVTLPGAPPRAQAPKQAGPAGSGAAGA